MSANESAIENGQRLSADSGVARPSITAAKKLLQKNAKLNLVA